MCRHARCLPVRVTRKRFVDAQPVVDGIDSRIVHERASGPLHVGRDPSIHQRQAAFDGAHKKNGEGPNSADREQEGAVTGRGETSVILGVPSPSAYSVPSTLPKKTTPASMAGEDR